MATLKELQDEKNALASKMVEMRDAFHSQEKQWKDDEQRQAWGKLNADYDAKDAQVRAAVEAESVDARMKQITDAQERSVNHGGVVPGREDTSHQKPLGHREDPASDPDADAHAIAGWMAGSRATEKQRACMKAMGITPQHEYVDLKPMTATQYRNAKSSVVERRAMTSQTGSSGGYTIEASTLIRTLEVNMLAYGGMRQVAQMINTTSGEPLLWPTFDDTGNVGALLAENTTIGSSVEPTLTQVTWNAYKISSTPILVPYELLQDSFVDLPTVLGEALGERIGRKTNTYYTTGTGSSQPKGIITAASSGVTAASATAIVFTELMALIHSVDPSYRPGAGFMMHDNVLLAIRQLKDSQNRPLYVSGLVDGMPDQLLGYGVTINQDMASSVATTNKTVLFGRLSNYKIRRAGPVRLYRLDERYRDTDQTGFIAFVREDGNLLKSATVPVKYLTQA